jgi:hypothetical protein
MEITCKDQAEDDRKYDFWTISSEQAIKKLKSTEEVRFPASDELLIDIDSLEAEAVFDKNLLKFQKHVSKALTIDRKVSRNGNVHIYVRLDRSIDNAERILFQTFLGSDQTRELLSYIRDINGDPHPTLFIETKTLLLGEGNVNA